MHLGGTRLGSCSQVTTLSMRLRWLQKVLVLLALKNIFLRLQVTVSPFPILQLKERVESW